MARSTQRHPILTVDLNHNYSSQVTVRRAVTKFQYTALPDNSTSLVTETRQRSVHRYSTLPSVGVPSVFVQYDAIITTCLFVIIKDFFLISPFIVPPVLLQTISTLMSLINGL